MLDQEQFWAGVMLMCVTLVCLGGLLEAYLRGFFWPVLGLGVLVVGLTWGWGLILKRLGY